jgi:phage gp45-like
MVFTDELSRHVGRYYGKFRGKVTDNADEKHQGTLVVTVPDVFGPDVEVVARACMPYGHFFVPPTGADVFVEFEAGDPEYPLWVGAWHAEGAAPAEAQVSPPDHRVIQTPAGHTIEIVDTEGEERILIRHPSNAFVSIDPNGSVLAANAKGSHLHLDAENGTATVVQQDGSQIAMADKGISLVNTAGTTINVVEDTVHIAAKNVVAEVTSVALGKGASEPTLMGDAFSTMWDLMLTHTHTPPAGPIASPLVPTMKLIPGVHLTNAVKVT